MPDQVPPAASAELPARSAASRENGGLALPIAVLVRAWLLTGVVDGLFSGILAALFYGSSVGRLFRGVASTLFGARVLDGGTLATFLGIAMHFGVALAWSLVFLVLATRVAALRRALDSTAGAVGVAAVYGPAIWLVMSLLVIPFLTKRPPVIAFRWWVQLVGHFPFVGLPIVGTVASGLRSGGRLMRDGVR